MRRSCLVIVCAVLSGVAYHGVVGITKAQPPTGAAPSTPATPTTPATPATPATPTTTTATPTRAGVATPSASGVFRLEDLTTEGGLTADQAAERAVATAPSIERARAAADIAASQADQAWLSVLPKLEVSGSYTRVSDIQQGQLTQGLSAEQEAQIRGLIAGVDDPEAQALFNANLQQQLAFANFEFPVLLDNYALRAHASYEISDLFFSVIPAYRGAQSYARAQAQQVAAERKTVALRAREAFFNYVRARGSLAVAEAAVVQEAAHEQQVSARVTAGLAARADLLRVRAQHAAARVGLARAEGSVRIAGIALRTLLHIDPEQEIVIGEDLTRAPTPVQGTQSDLVRRAFDRRHEIRALKLVVTSREKQSEAYAGRRWPRLSVAANFEYSNPNPRVIPQQEEWRESWDVGATARWSLNEFLDANVQRTTASSEADQARADLAAVSDDVRVEVTQALADIDTARTSLEAATIENESAEESYRVREQQLRAGVVVTSDLIDAVTDLTRARLDLLSAVIDLRIAHARLSRAIGE